MEIESNLPESFEINVVIHLHERKDSHKEQARTFTVV